VTSPEGVFVHPLGLCESATVGAGTKVWAFAHVMAGARIGENCNVCDHAFVESGAVVGKGVTVKNGVLVWDKVVVEDDVFLGPGAVFTNDLTPRAGGPRDDIKFLPTWVCRGATIGANVTVVCGTTIGERAFVGAGAVVTSDVPPHALIVGNPARRVGWVCICGRRLDEGFICEYCGRRFRGDGSGGLRECDDLAAGDRELAAAAEVSRLLGLPG
jgi:UDP-2-acetamido-3-amino-2,3-dideoxy-glucuronate N-acetyltransferase